MTQSKLLITTDFHALPKALAGLRSLLAREPFDVVILAGDLINNRDHELPYVDQFIDLVMDEFQLPLFGLHGNNEPVSAMERYRERNINIHLESRKWQDYWLCGVGGWGTLDEPVFTDLSVDNLVINQQTIFVTHIPPRTVEASPNGPLVHLFGHKHVLSYTKKAGPTLQIQCPAGVLGKATVLTLPELKVEFIEFGICFLKSRWSLQEPISQ